MGRAFAHPTKLPNRSREPFDEAPDRPFMVSLPRTMVAATRGFTLQSDAPPPATIAQVSYLDSR
jgi:hypothetical protein